LAPALPICERNRPRLRFGKLRFEESAEANGQMAAVTLVPTFARGSD
jgi:hypothetical protein